MTRESRRWLQTFLLVAMVAAGLRLVLIYRSRHEPAGRRPAHNAPLNGDYYVNPRKLHAYDLKSASELTRQPAWVREGYKYTYYPFEPGAQRADFKHSAGLLLPIERLDIKEVVLNRTPDADGTRQVLAVFEQGGKSYAFPIGVENHGDYNIYADEILYVQDPKELYKHWPQEVWDAIERHVVKPGMNELQVSFSLGVGVPQAGSVERKVVNYPNGGKPVQVTFENGRAVDIKGAAAA
jgi:hypothetical protein